MATAAVLAGTLTSCWAVEDEVTLREHGSAFSLAHAQVDDDWQLVLGGEPHSELGVQMWEVMADVEATNIGDEAREMHLEFVFSLAGKEVMTATCVSGDEVAPGDSESLGCAGTKQVTPNDFDEIRVRALT